MFQEVMHKNKSHVIDAQNMRKLILLPQIKIFTLTLIYAHIHTKLMEMYRYVSSCKITVILKELKEFYEAATSPFNFVSFVKSSDNIVNKLVAINS